MVQKVHTELHTSMDVYFIEAKTSSKNIEKLLAVTPLLFTKVKFRSKNLWGSFRVMQTKDKEHLDAACVLALDSGPENITAMISITETT